MERGRGAGTLEEIISWLEGVEAMASETYQEAAAAFAADEEFSSFLQLLAREEGEHRELLSLARERADLEGMPEGGITVDEATRRKVETPFVRARSLLREGGLTRTDLLGLMAEAEYSEWNEIFLYVIDTLKRRGRVLQKAVAEIDQHRREIERFIAGFAGAEGILEKFRQLRPLWQRRLLVVEDDPAMANLLRNLLRAEMEVVLAGDGEEGLARLEEGHFDVVVCDVDMPKVNGIELYRRASGDYPDLRDRFVFFTATQNPEHHRFLRAAKVVMLPKPSPVGRLRQTIHAVAEGRPGS